MRGGASPIAHIEVVWLSMMQHAACSMQAGSQASTPPRECPSSQKNEWDEEARRTDPLTCLVATLWLPGELMFAAGECRVAASESGHSLAQQNNGGC